MNEQTVEQYRAHIGATRVEKWKYKEPYLELSLAFKDGDHERIVRDVIDLSVPGQLHLRLEGMRKQAHRELAKPDEEQPSVPELKKGNKKNG